MKDKKKIYIAVIILIIILLACLVYFIFFNKKEDKLNVFFDSNGGSQIDSVIISDDNKLKLPSVPTKEGYTFAYYEFDNAKIATDGMTVTKDVVLKANWIKNDAEYVTVTYSNYQGNPYKIKYEKGSPLKWLELPLRSDYELSGWVNEDNKIIPVGYILDKDINLLPRWLNRNNKKITITVDYSSGQDGFKYISLDNDVTALPIEPVKEGYTFAGWKLPDGIPVTEKTILNGDTTIVASWNKSCECPSGYTLDSDGKNCLKTTTTNVVSKNTCPSGYSSRNGKCLKYSAKYEAVNGNSGWTCNSKSDYMYTEENAGGAMMWCVPTTSISKINSCPSGYELKDNNCIKIEKISCATN